MLTASLQKVQALTYDQYASGLNFFRSLPSWFLSRLLGLYGKQGHRFFSHEGASLVYRIVNVLLLTSSLVVLGACATKMRQPEGPPKAPVVRFGKFKAVYLKHVAINPKAASVGNNQKAAIKIDENLFVEMRRVFPNLKEAAQIAPKGAGILMIEPYIEDLKFVGGGARFMVGSMAGSSAVLMKVTYTDQGSGKIIADPEFFQKASAYSDGVGIADNLMLSYIAKDIANYTAQHK